MRAAVSGTVTSAPWYGQEADDTQPDEAPSVERRHRRYVPKTPQGLHELISSVQLSEEELELVPEESSPTGSVKCLALAAVQQQIDYALGALLEGLTAKPAEPLDELIGVARQSLDRARVTVVIHTETANTLPRHDTLRKKVNAKLAGGTLVAVDYAGLRGRALVLKSQPDEVAWLSALDLELGWDSEAGGARIGIMSRLLVQISAKPDWRLLWRVSAPAVEDP